MAEKIEIGSELKMAVGNGLEFNFEVINIEICIKDDKHLEDIKVTVKGNHLPAGVTVFSFAELGVLVREDIMEIVS